YNIVLLGTGAVGKSAITLRIVKDKFDPSYDPTIEDFCFHKQNIYKETYCIFINLEKLKKTKKGIKQGVAFLVVYSVDSQLSFKGAEDIYNKIKMVKDDQEYHVVLFANKCDLSDSRREVQKQDGQNLANSWGVTFFEGSALTAVNIVEAFYELVRLCRKEKKEKNNKKVIDEGESTTCCLDVKQIIRHCLSQIFFFRKNTTCSLTALIKKSFPTFQLAFFFTSSVIGKMKKMLNFLDDKKDTTKFLVIFMPHKAVHQLMRNKQKQL
ncbi:RAP1B, member of RAS oncogene family, partial [Reticulomyxa filosa]